MQIQKFRTLDLRELHIETLNIMIKYLQLQISQKYGVEAHKIALPPLALCSLHKQPTGGIQQPYA